MKFRYHCMLLAIPLGLWIAWFVINEVNQARLAPHFKPVDQLNWRFDGTSLTAGSEVSKSGEIEQFKITITDQAGRVVYTMDYQIDWDMGGGGFVRAMQVDDDPALEIVFVKKGGKSNRVLDVSADGIAVKALHTVSDDAQVRIKEYLRYFAPNPFTIGFFFFITLAYYFLYIPIYLGFRWLISAIRKRGKD